MRRTLTALLFASVLPVAASAQVAITNQGSTFGLGTADLKQTIINVVNWVLGLLGLIAVIMIIASVTIIAAQGGSEAADRAKRSLTGAIIGLVVILLAWAIVLFVVGTTRNVTG